MDSQFGNFDVELAMWTEMRKQFGDKVDMWYSIKEARRQKSPSQFVYHVLPYDTDDGWLTKECWVLLDYNPYD